MRVLEFRTLKEITMSFKNYLGYEEPIVPSDEDVAEHLADNPVGETCGYCGIEVATDHVDAAAVDDDETWELIAAEHAAGCEWVATRAHRIAVRA
jgi:hypothetical protein